MAFEQRLFAHIKSLLRHPVAYLATFSSFRSATDFSRWQELSNLKVDWDKRTQIMAGFIPAGSRVIEFGAARLVLPLYLRPGCSYQPADLVKRSDETLVFDLNGTLPNLPSCYDYAVFSGVLEYVKDPDRVLCWLNGVADGIIFSYAVTDHLSDPITRRRHGWINSLSDTEVRQMICRIGLTCETSSRWEQQHLYVCKFPASVTRQVTMPGSM